MHPLSLQDSYMFLPLLFLAPGHTEPSAGLVGLLTALRATHEQLSVLPSLQFSGHTAPPPLDQSQSPPSRRLGVCRQDAF
eukprot:1157087-Pelagomonas_calceolata.AAC.20